jgi:predicted nucleotide-binding protein
VSKEPYFFVSYVRDDARKVSAFLAALRECGVAFWSDAELRPGENWLAAIESALYDAAGHIVFISPQSLASHWVRHEIAASFGDHEKTVVPVILQRVPDLPEPLSSRALIDASHAETPNDVAVVAREHAEHLIEWLAEAPSEPQVSHSQSAREAREIVADLKARPLSLAEDEATPPRSVFVIHGHDEGFLAMLEGFLAELGVEPVVLKRMGGQDLSLWQRFTRWGRETRYAIALLSADDLGAARREYEAEYEGRKVGPQSLQFRARQNVILELGYFYGYLDWDHVFVLLKPPATPYPRFEMPSDLAGIVYDVVDDSGTWRSELRRRLRDAGFTLRGGPS